MQRIIYKNIDDTIAILIPTPDALTFATIEDIAEKDVPFGLPYWIVDVSVIPADRTARNQWRLDGTQGEPDGYGGESNEFTEGVIQ